MVQSAGRVLCVPTRFAGVLLLLVLSAPAVGQLPTPAAALPSIFWGDVHGHTNLSDGKGSLDDFFRYARDVAKLDFVIVTDHDFGNAAPWHLTQPTWQLIQSKADEYSVDGQFVAIAGYEWTSQSKYWTEVDKDTPSEQLFPGPPRFYNHKNVYFPAQVEDVFRAKDARFMTPDLLAEAVNKVGGLIHNNHPSSEAEGRDQWDYSLASSDVIANTEMYSDIQRYEGHTYHVNMEQSVRAFLNRGGKTGFVRGTDTHEGKSAARTAVFAKELTRAAIFDALRHRRNYAVSHDRIAVNVRLNDHGIGETVDVDAPPTLTIEARGTDSICELAIVRDGSIVYCAAPNTREVNLKFTDENFRDTSYYYVRITQVDEDEHGNPSRAWTSPIWVRTAADDCLRRDHPASRPSAR